jgi:hypothetical protein
MKPPEDRPWEQPGAVRRDCEPHRGPFLAGLATASSLLGFVSVCCPPLGALSAAVGLIVLFLARRDEALLRSGQMDPDGFRFLESVRTDARIGIHLGLLGLGCISLFAFLSGWMGRCDP